MIAILDEKTREASSLKSEVHRLMNVVSAGKAAIAKLQQDSQEMSRNNGESLNEDMKKEAIRKLSQMIKDKDFEIEALSQKNSTLLQVIYLLLLLLDSWCRAIMLRQHLRCWLDSATKSCAKIRAMNDRVIMSTKYY